VIGDAVAEVWRDRFDRFDRSPESPSYRPRRWFAPGPFAADGPSRREMAYRLPTLPGGADPRPALEAVREAIRRGNAWYAAAVCARIAPYVGPRGRRELADMADLLRRPWDGHVAKLARRAEPWPSAVAELEAAHPAVPALNREAGEAPPDRLADTCVRAVQAIVDRHARTFPTQAGAPPTPSVPPTSGAFPPEPLQPEQTDADEELDRARPGTFGRGAGGGPPPGPPYDPVPSGGPPERWVTTGIAAPTAPGTPLDPARRLAPDAAYLFWLQIGARVAGSLDDEPLRLDLPADATPGTRVTVAVFGYPDEITVDAAPGEFVLRQDGRLEVSRQPDGRPAGGTRLFVPIHTPARDGRHRLRCNLYCRGTLLQSRVVELDVGPPGPGTSATIVDYAVDTTLDPENLARIRPLTLSVFVNDSGNGTHGFRFFSGSAAPVTGDALLTEGALQDTIDRVRADLREASWGHRGEYATGTTFRYDRRHPGDAGADIIRLARTGYLLWTSIGGEVAEAAGQGPPEQAPIRWLADRMRRPGTVEIASKVSSRLVVPATLFYDHPLDQRYDLGLCPVALAAIKAGADLAGEPCFQGDCPSYGDESVVCPSGFWGYRHELGLPQSILPPNRDRVDPGQAAIQHEITCGDQPRCVVGISSEFAGPHPDWVSSLGRPVAPPYADGDALLAALRTRQPPTHLVYFYCHGAVVDGQPALRVGPADSPGISYVHASDGRMYWPEGRPLVFLNGCRTAAVEPRYAMTFVDAFIRRARASGLIGTEIVTYEALAEAFGRAVLDRFVTRRQTLAAAVRGARLELLAAGNPLGLIYVAYAPPQLRLT
jgi:hypothetical protein